jgi:hypothetical protein
MSDIAGIAANAVSAYQNALSTVSNNIANVATDGYSRQDVALSALPVTKIGGLFLGSGVAIDNVKRQYDAFVESNLRKSTSDLASQEPMVNYANRVVDVMGGQTMGLNTALDQFFNSVRALSANTSSTVLRSSFIQDAKSVADRFGQLSEQLDLIQGEVQSAVDNAVSQVNTLTKQLALVNGQLVKEMTEAKQPPDLLDQRDLLLRKLSELTRVNTAFAVNGQVTVSLGPTVTRDVVVAGTTAVRIGVADNSASSDKSTLVLDPYGKSTALAGVTSGTLAGLMAFQEQVLATARGSLDNLAKTFASQINNVHTQGVDAYGNTGQALFAFDPKANPAAGIQVAFSDPLLIAAASQFRVIENANNTSGTDASVVFDSAAAASFAGPSPLSTALVNNDHPSAARTITVSASVPVSAVATIPQGMQDIGIYLDTLQPGQQLQVLTRDGRQIAGQSMASNSALLGALMTTDNGFEAGAGYRDAYLNADVTQQSVKLTGTATGPQSFLGVGIAGSAAGNTATQTAARIVANKAAFLMGSAAQAAGITDIALDPNDPTKLLLTTDSTALAHSALAASNSGGMQFGAGAGLRMQYKGMSVFYGAQASVQNQPIYNSKDEITGSKAFPALLQGTGIQALTNGIAANAITVDGVSLGALSVPVTSARAVATWLNTVSTQTGVTASAANIVNVAENQLRLRSSGLVINGSTINLTGVSTQAQLAAAINSTPNRTFFAQVSAEGKLRITNAAGHEGEDLSIGNRMGSGSENALGIPGGTYRGQVSLTQPLTDANGAPITKPIQLGFGSAGTPNDLAQLGFRTGAFIAGAAKDDLLVFVTGTGTATVSASYKGAAVDSKQALRTKPMNVEFLTATQYRITDTQTGTVLAERTLDPTQLSPGISYQGLQLSFTAPPNQGDQFALDGNQDGLGNNENMLALNDLERKAVVGNKTMTNAYIDQVIEMGNIAHQATISQTALTVVHDQAVTSRDQVSGVSLDKEAGDLIRYQQAYQAAAKAMQVASNLFDSVLQIH